MERKISRITLIVFNSVFVILGLAILGIGIFLRVGKNFVLDLIGRAPLPEQAGELVETFDPSKLIWIFSWVVLGIGGFIFLVGFAGCWGAYKRNKCLLTLYSIVLGILLLIKIAVIITLINFSSMILTIAGAFIEISLQNSYSHGIAFADGSLVIGADPISVAWDLAQITLQCCGSAGPSSFSMATHWDRMYNVSVSSIVLSINATVPLSCCKMTDPSAFPNNLDQVQFVDIHSCVTLASDNATNTGGCFGKVSEIVTKNLRIVQIVAGIISGVEFLGIIAACRIICSKKQHPAAQQNIPMN